MKTVRIEVPTRWLGGLGKSRHPGIPDPTSPLLQFLSREVPADKHPSNAPTGCQPWQACSQPDQPSAIRKPGATLVRLLLQVALLAATGLSLLADQAQFTDVTTPVLANPDYGVGVAWGDFDGDGDLDLAAANGGWAGEAKGSRLFRNDGAGVFADVTPADLASAFAHSVAWADYDNDGDIDLLVGGGGTRLLRNDGRGIFTNVTTGLLQEPSFEATWVDYDSDGYVDIYIVVSGSSLIPAHNRLLRNEGLDVFRNVTTPPLEQPLEATASSWGDYDNDGDLDLSVLNCNCGSAASFSRLFRNDGDGAFADVTAGPLKDTRIALVSVWGDFDNDGNLDLLIGHYEGPTTVLRNDAGGGY